MDEQEEHLIAHLSTDKIRLGKFCIGWLAQMKPEYSKPGKERDFRINGKKKELKQIKITEYGK